MKKLFLILCLANLFSCDPVLAQTCTHTVHRQILTRLTGEITQIKDVADPSDLALTRTIRLVNTATGQVETFTYTGQEYSIFKGAGNYILTNSKTCVGGGSANGYGVPIEIAASTSPVGVTTTALRTSINVFAPLSGADHMVCKYRKAGTSWWSFLKSYNYIATQNFTITGLTPNTQYEILLQTAYAAKYYVAVSSPIIITVTTLP